MSKYYVVSGDILPDVLEQVMQARILLQSGKAKRISEAVKMVGISRGTYYKYKDAVFSFNAEQSNRKAIISMILRNEKGTLSKVLSLVSVKQVNVLAINQTIPINGIANVALTLDISDLEISIQSLVSLIETMPMVEKADLVAVE
ncbi:ACT domain-containing protein [Holdemanella porci]|uniref:ACT domain-containing protein n=1 Tax=Holdemanella porci TaxID=2652276 RepID=UPI003AB31328